MSDTYNKMAESIFTSVKTWVSHTLAPLQKRVDDVVMQTAEIDHQYATLDARIEAFNAALKAIPVGVSPDEIQRLQQEIARFDGELADAVRVSCHSQNVFREAAKSDLDRAVESMEELRKSVDEQRTVATQRSAELAAELNSLAAQVADGAVALAEFAKTAEAERLAVIELADAAIEKRLQAWTQLPEARGEKGEPGEPGKDGRDGVDGAPGVNGKDGAPGEKGADGINGRDGADGVHGKDGAAGAVGEKGVDGGDGTDGRDGRDGEPGRDAWQIDVLEGIDPSRKYQRGTYATYRGGEIRSFRVTDPVDLEKASWAEIQKAGWTISREGVARIEFIPGDDFRSIECRATLTTGRSFVTESEIPVVLHRGVFKPGEAYARGDQVTFGGSTWIANSEGVSGRPGEPGAAGWLLSNKRGADGKDGKDGKDGSPGKDFTPRY